MITSRYTTLSFAVIGMLLAILLPKHAAANHGLQGVANAYAMLAMIFLGYSFINFVLVFLNMFMKNRWLRIVCIAMLVLNVVGLAYLNTLLTELGGVLIFVVAILLLEAFFIYKSIEKPRQIQ